MRIGIDIYGGDYAPENCLKGIEMVLPELHHATKLVLIGDQHIAKQYFKNNPHKHHLEYIHTDEMIEMHEHPAKAYMKKTKSSINIGFHLLKNKEIDAFISAGNSGAMLAGSMLTLKTISGVIRPTIGTIIPKPNGKHNLLLDVGTNVDTKSDVLYQFGLLGNIYAKEIMEIENPRVALLNIGEESEKGNLVVQAAHQLMKNNPNYHFVGNVEGRHIFSDRADVIVTDGFTGNIILKMAEAFYTLILKRKIKDEYFAQFNYELYGGTPVIGVNGNVIIGHGISSPLAFKNMVLQAKNMIKSQLNDKIKKALNND
ncbi:MAG: phosphate acyltransferase PlsX [Bacteroidia bacterium]|nr:phosphate acyltransferase PlsX [Bacteroidia bacterium]